MSATLKHILTSDGNFYTVDTDMELYHHGVKGMKWGVRKSTRTSGNRASNYSNKQRIQDRKLYGKNAVKRIDKKMSKGEGILSARHDEVKRRERVAKVKEGSIKAQKALITVGRAYLTDQLFFGGIGTRAAKTAVKNIGRFAISAFVYARGGRDIRWYD